MLLIVALWKIYAPTPIYTPGEKVKKSPDTSPSIRRGSRAINKYGMLMVELLP